MKKLVVGLVLAVSGLQAWCAGYPLHVEAIKEEDGVWAITAHNAGKAPVFLSVSLTNRQNVRIGGMSSGSHKALEPGAKETLLLAIAEKQEEKMEFQYTTKWVFGRGINRADHSGIYRPPFPADMTFETINSASGETTEGRLVHSIDVLMPEGTPVIAARTGYVMDTSGEDTTMKRKDARDGVWPYYDDRSKMGSYVRLIHDDGTWAEYLHMRTDSIKVKSGQLVEAGTQLGESGSSGMSVRPHLQFRVMKPGNGFGVPETVPIRMDLAGRGQVLVKAGDTIGASLSVSPEPETTRSDPLVVATVKRAEANSSQGVYSLGGIAKGAVERMGGAGAGMLVAALVALLSWLGWRGYKLTRRSRSNKSGSKLAQSTNNSPATALLGEGSSNAAGGDTAGDISKNSQEAIDEMDMRPKKGFMVADWERQFLEAVSLAMPLGYEIQTKVSLNRILPRPLWISPNPKALALVRGASLDVVVVRSSDHRIMAVLELERGFDKTEDQMETERAAKAMLDDAGIKHARVSKDVGASEIRDLLKKLAPNAVSYAKLAERALNSL